MLLGKAQAIGRLASVKWVQSARRTSIFRADIARTFLSSLFFNLAFALLPPAILTSSWRQFYTPGWTLRRSRVISKNFSRMTQFETWRSPIMWHYISHEHFLKSYENWYSRSCQNLKKSIFPTDLTFFNHRRRQLISICWVK